MLDVRDYDVDGDYDVDDDYDADGDYEHRVFDSHY